MNKQDGTVIAWILRIITTAGVTLLVALNWKLSQTVEVHNVRIENNRAAIETILETILKNAPKKPPDQN